MIIYQFKVKAKPQQYEAIDEAIKTSEFIQNKCLRYWMNNQDVSKYDLNKYCQILAKEFKFANELNSMARQYAAERAWSAVFRFDNNCKKKVKGKKGYPKFQKHCRSVEYKTSGWKLAVNRKAITFLDKKNIGTLKFIGTYDFNYYQLNQIKRVRLVKRADGYYAQFTIQIDLQIETQPTGKGVGLDLGIKSFLTLSNGNTIENPQFYRKSEKQLNRANRQKSKKYKKGAKPQSNNYHKARNRYARKHLRVSRQRQEYATLLAYCVIQSNDLIAYEDLNMKAMVRNRRLAKSIGETPSLIGFDLSSHGESLNQESPSRN
ncbi:transposase [Okeania sp.]|uniref:RNA-guided endonuclease InsQ/TnpB family protein n=1 Tax=Okeania sp. TaxID=3100323 RepID=UPI002B4B1BF6|nr:transposase [Okeania sp.]MEB3340771.1 transposase [Okeania sp.]